MRAMWLFVIFLTAGLCAAESYEDVFAKPEEFPTYSNKNLMDLVPDLEANLNNPEFLYNYAWLAREEGDFETATTYIEKAVALRPQNPFLHFKAGQIYLAKGDKQNAQNHFEKALESEYEYLSAWFELVKLAPEYFYNLGQLFGEKAHQASRQDLADEAIGYYREYIDSNPNGEFLDAARAGIRDMELLKSEIASRERISKSREEQQRRIAERKLAQKREMEQFRTTRRRVVGVFFNTFGPSENYVYYIRDDKRESCITKRIYQKEIPDGYIPSDYDTVNALGATSLSEFAVGAGYFFGPFILRGNISLGRSNLKRTYLRDTTVTVPLVIAETLTVVDDSTYYPGDTISHLRISRDDMTIASINSLRFSTEGLFNIFYANPLLFYISAGADAGYVYLAESESYFESNWIYGAGIGGGAMLRFSNFLVDIGYRYNIIGSSAGGLLTIGTMLKF